MFFDSEVKIYYDLLKNGQILSQCGKKAFSLNFFRIKAAKRFETISAPKVSKILI
jgi:hypothetical protein